MSLRAAALGVGLAAVLAGASACAAAVSSSNDAAPPQATDDADAHCPPAATVPTQDEVLDGLRRAVDNGVLWKATKGGRTVWLYGTIHVAQMAWMYPGPQVMKAVMGSDVVALELDPTDPDIVARLQKAIGRRADAPALPAALQRRLQARMVAACLAPATLAGLRPELQAVSLEVLEGRALGLYPEFGIDNFLAGLSHGLKKPVRSLETPESQAALLVSDDPAETERNVGDLLDELESGKGPQVLQRLAGDWQRGDLADLDAYASWCECLDTPEQKADFVKLVDERNPLMADKVVKWHAEGKSLFVAVGTLHLVGRMGLPELLRARGFQVERVKYADRP
jgi:uncharacterized protein YbaP (TraB family)